MEHRKLITQKMWAMTKTDIIEKLNMAAVLLDKPETFVRCPYLDDVMRIHKEFGNDSRNGMSTSEAADLLCTYYSRLEENGYESKVMQWINGVVKRIERLRGSTST